MSKTRKREPHAPRSKEKSFAKFFGQPWVSGALICFVGYLAYSNTLYGSFHLDDETSIVYNTAIKNLSDLGGIWQNTPTRFVTYLSFALNYSVHGLNVFGYHVVSLAIHLAAALMVWLLVRQILQSPIVRELRVGESSAFAPLLVALIFVAHPIQTQAVNYIAQRATVLASLFYFLSLYFYGSARLKQIQGGSGRGAYALFGTSGLAALLALFSKEIALTLPFALFAYEFFFFRNSLKINWKFFLPVMGLFVLIPLALMALNLLSLSDAPSITARTYALTQPRVIVTYLRLLAFPVDQNLDYDFPLSGSLFETTTLASVAVLFSLLGLAYALFARRRILSFGILWFFLTLMVESSFIPLADVIFEHRLYLPMFGFSIFFVGLLFELVGRKTLIGFTIMILGSVTVLGWLTYDRNRVWRDEVSMWTDVIQKSPLKSRAYNNRGRALGDLGRKQEALADFSRAIMLNPNSPDAYNNRANIYVQMGKPDSALADCERAMANASHLKYQRAMIYFNRGTAYMLKGQLDRAIEDLSYALADDPTYESAHFNRAIAYARTNQYQKAIDDYTYVIENNPEHAKAFNNRGIANRELGKLDEALRDFNQSLSLQPDFGSAYFNRGIVFNMRGRLDEALKDLNKGIRLSPNSPEGFYHRGVVHFRRKEYKEAVGDFTRAIQLRGEYGDAYVERARTYSASGEYGAARADLDHASQMGIKIDQALLREIQGRRK